MFKHGGVRRRRRGVALALCSVGLVALGYAPSSLATSYENGASEVISSASFSLEPMSPRSTSHVLTLSINTGYCLGEPKPVFDHVKRIERPAGKDHVKRSIITAFVRYPGPRVSEICNDLAYTVKHQISLKRPRKGIAVFDGNFSPPRRAEFLRRPEATPAL